MLWSVVCRLPDRRVSFRKLGKCHQRRQSTHNLVLLARLDVFGQFAERPDTLCPDRQTLRVCDRLAEQLQQRRDLVRRLVAGAGRGDRDRVEEHEGGLEGDFAVRGGAGRGHVPQPGEEFGPDSLVEFEAGNGRNEAGRRCPGLRAAGSGGAN